MLLLLLWPDAIGIYLLFLQHFHSTVPEIDHIGTDRGGTFGVLIVPTRRERLMGETLLKLAGILLV